MCSPCIATPSLPVISGLSLTENAVLAVVLHCAGGNGKKTGLHMLNTDVIFFLCIFDVKLVEPKNADCEDTKGQGECPYQWLVTWCILQVLSPSSLVVLGL